MSRRYACTGKSGMALNPSKLLLHYYMVINIYLENQSILHAFQDLTFPVNKNTWWSRYACLIFGKAAKLEEVRGRRFSLARRGCKKCPDPDSFSSAIIFSSILYFYPLFAFDFTCFFLLAQHASQAPFEHSRPTVCLRNDLAYDWLFSVFHVPPKE